MLTPEITVNMLICKEGASCCPLIHNITLHCTRKENSSHVRKPRTVLDSGFHNVDTGFRYLSVELGLWIPIVGGIPDSLSCIPDSKSQDFGSHKQNFPGFRNPEKTIFGMAMIEVRDEGFWWKRCGNAGSEPLSLPDPIYRLLARTRDLYIASSQLLSKYCEWTDQFFHRARFRKQKFRADQPCLWKVSAQCKLHILLHTFTPWYLQLL